MDPIHLHLLLNHIPIIGTAFALLILAYGFISKNRTVENTGLVALVLVALVTIPAYLTGEEAEHAVENIAGISDHFLEEHEELSEIGLWIMVGTGVLALVSLLIAKFKERKTALNALTLLAAIGTFVMMVIIGNHGGKIRHTELIDGNLEKIQSLDHHNEHEDHDDDDGD